MIHCTRAKQHYTLLQTYKYIEELYAKLKLSASGTVDISNPVSEVTVHDRAK